MAEYSINADDYGWNETCSKAIIEAFNKGFITTTTMMSTGAYFDEATSLILGTRYKDKVGIHLDLTEGRPLTRQMQEEAFFCDANGDFHMHPNRYKKLSKKQKEIVYQELLAQIERFEKTGLKCHHIDSHHHIHTAPNIFPIVLKLMKEYGIEYIRVHRNVGNIPGSKRILKQLFNLNLHIKQIAYSKSFGGYVDYIASTSQIKKNDSLEVMCHPDYDPEGKLIDRDANAPYMHPYGKELEVLYNNLLGKMKVIEKDG